MEGMKRAHARLRLVWAGSYWLGREPTHNDCRQGEACHWPFWHQQLIGQDTLLEDIITYSDLLFGAEDMPHASALLPPGVALSRAGVISFHPVDDGPQPGSSRTRYKVVDPTEHPTTLGPGGTSASATPPEGAVERSIGDLQGQQPVVMEEPDSAIVAADVNSAPSSAGRSAFTPDEELDLLFDPSFIPQNLRDSLGSDLHVGHQSREKKNRLMTGTTTCLD